MSEILENSAPVIDKSWTYTEKNNKTTTYHTISIKGKKFSHIAEIKETARTMRQRSDFNISNVRSVNSFYGTTRNMFGVILCAILAAIAVIVAIVMLTDDNTGLGIGLLVLGGILGFAAFMIYKNIKPSFYLEIETVVPMGTLTTNTFIYGNPETDFNKDTKSNVIIDFFKTLFRPLLRLFKRRGNKYKFEMDPETGLDIIDTLGDYIIQ